MWDESGEAWTGLGMRDGMSLDKTTRVVPSLNMMRYWGDKVGSKGIFITVPARLRPDGRVVSSTLCSGVWFGNDGGLIAVERSEEAIVILDRRIHRGKEAQL